MIRPTGENSVLGDPLDEWIDRVCEADPLPPLVEEPEPLRGPPLSPTERRDAQLRLTTFQAPSDFVALTQTLCHRCSSEDWFNRPHLKFLHDAYRLAEFVGFVSVERVLLAGAPEQWPDGYVKIGRRTHNVEITSTHGGRKLGDEYRGVKSVKMDPAEKWVARAESIPHYLEEAISAKSSRFCTCFSLISVPNRPTRLALNKELWQPVLAHCLPEHQ
jgi:hypothetical protein